MKAIIGVASYGELGHVPARLIPLLNFLVTLEPHTLMDIELYVVAYTQKEYTGL